jgi:two-component system sensor histidine kinase ChiS
MSNKQGRPKISSPLILLTIFVIATLLLIWFTIRLVHSTKSNLVSKMEIEVARIERSFDDEIEHTSTIVKNINRQILKSPNDKLHISKVLSSYQNPSDLNNNFSWTIFSWVNQDYQMTVDASYGILSNPIDVSIKDYSYPLERKPGEFQLGSTTIGETSKKWIIPGGIGLVDKNGRFLGATVIGFDLRILLKTLNRVIENPDVSFKLFSKNGISIINEGFRNSESHSNYDDSTTNIELERIINEVNTSSNKKFYDISLITNRRAMFAKTVGDYPYIIITQYHPDAILEELTNVIISRLSEVFSILFSFAVLIFLIYREIKQARTLFRIKLVADRANNSKTEFLIKVTHEFKNFIFGIHGCAEIIRSDLKRIFEELKNENNPKNLHRIREIETDLEMANNIAETSHDLNSFIDELMELTRLKEEDLEIKASPSPLNLNNLTKTLIPQLRKRAKSSNVILVTEIDKNLHKLPNLDPKRISQIITGLTSNAIKYSKENTVVMISIKNINDGEVLKSLYQVYGVKKSKAVEILISDQNSHINIFEIKSSLHNIKNFKKFDLFLTKLPAIKFLIEKQGGIFEVRSDNKRGNEARIIF